MSVLNIYLFFLIVVYRLSHWHTSFHTHTHTFWLYMVHSASHAKTHCHSFVLLHASALHSDLVHCSIKARKTKHTGTLNMLYFFCIHFVFINCVLPLKQNLLARPSFSKFISFMSCIALPKQQKQNARAHWLFSCNIFSVHIPFGAAHSGTDWAKHIGTVLFCFILVVVLSRSGS